MHVHISHELDLADLNVIYVQQQNRLHIHQKQEILTNSVTLWIL